MEGLQVLQVEIEGFLWLGSIPPRGSVMNKGMEWDKVKSLGDISTGWLERSTYDGEYYKIRQRKEKKRLRNDNGEPQCQAKEFRLDFVGFAGVE